MDNLRKVIREVPDFPKPGINIYDITTLLKHPEGLRQTVDALAAEYEGMKIDTVVGDERRRAHPFEAGDGPACFFGPCMHEASSCTTPSALGKQTNPAFSQLEIGNVVRLTLWRSDRSR